MPDPRIVIGDFYTGDILTDLDTISDEWENRRNAPDDIKCVVDLADPDLRALDLKNAASGNKNYIAKLIGDNVMAFGLLRKPRYDRAARTLELRGEGMGAYFRDRFVLPVAALTNPLIDPVTNEPNVLTNTTLSGWSLGTILKKVIQQSMTWPGGNLPITFMTDEVGTHEDEFIGASLTRIATVLDNYAARQNGPDWEFLPTLTSDRQGITHLFRTGTEAQPRLRSESIHQFDYSVPEPSIDNLITEIDSSDMSFLAWTTGGRSTGEALVASAYNSAPITAGYALFESIDTDHSNASEQATIQSYSNERIRTSAEPTEFWPFRIRTDASPYPGEYRVGDLCDVHVRDDDYIPDGTYRRAIASLGGDEDPDWITVTTATAPLG